MQILIFGGSFSPPTLAHEEIIRECLRLSQFDEVWIMPSGDRPDKHISLDDSDRLEMLRVVAHETFGDDPRLRVSDFELKLPRPTQTYRTLRHLAEAFPGDEFSFVFGGDAYRAMSTWPRAAEYMHTIRMVLFTDSDVPEIAEGRALRLNVPDAYKEISSSAARIEVQHGADTSMLLSKPVITFIQRHNLFAP